MMTIHGAALVAAGVGFGYSAYRAMVLPAWTDIALAVGVIVNPLSAGFPAALGLIGVGLRYAAFGGMGIKAVPGSRRPPLNRPHL